MTQLGDALVWLAFLVPWCLFALYAHVALFLRLGVLGLVEASCVCVFSLPFWRAACGRPAFQPLAALLVRFHFKRNLKPFEEIEICDAGGELSGDKEGRRHKDWRVAFEKRVPDAQAELAAFTAEHAAALEDDNLKPPRDAGFSGSSKTPSNDEELIRVLNPASRLKAAGLGVFPLCDETLCRPNAAAKRHFPATCAAVSAANGFGARLWVLSPDTNRTHLGSKFSRGVSDGYWRAHVVLDADEAETEETFSRETPESLDKSSSRRVDADAADAVSFGAKRATLGDFAGIKVGDETRRVEIGDLFVVNDLFERRWFHDNKRARSGGSANASNSSPRETPERRGGKKNVSRERAGAAVVLTFDVLRPEHAACRVSYVRHKARLVREVGERNAGALTWRSLALAMLGNLS